MIDQSLQAFLERGGSMIVGTVSPDGAPHAQRGWGCSVVGDAEIRLLLDAMDQDLGANIAGDGRIAVTSADVRNLRAVQLKGRVTGVEPPLPDDLERCAMHNEELVTDIFETDFYPRELSERMVPSRYVVAIVRVEEVFDQTPGPGAGAPVTSGPS